MCSFEIPDTGFKTPNFSTQFFVLFLFTVLIQVLIFDFSLQLLFFSVQIGRFFGEIDPSLMRHLVNISVYAFNKSYDYQSVCEPGAAPKQGAGHRSAYVVSDSQVTPPSPGDTQYG